MLCGAQTLNFNPGPKTLRWKFRNFEVVKAGCIVEAFSEERELFG